jgi:prepilin-type N-terminal cleavage/methylation domain-containing protein
MTTDAVRIRRRPTRAFTLVEILIVVVILGILAGIVIPQFTNASTEAQQSVTYSELQKLRRHIGVFQARNTMKLPAVTEGNGTWGELVSRDYFMSAPLNPWVGGENARVIKYGTGPDTAYQTTYGWIYDPTTGNVWAGGFDGADRPLPR